jgi:hypothetical protein
LRQPMLQLTLPSCEATLLPNHKLGVEREAYSENHGSY